MFDIGSGLEIQITTDPADRVEPAISGDHVVWQDYRNGNADIFMADLSEILSTGDLKAQVIGYDLPMDIETGLTDKLDIAIASLVAENEKMAVNNLNAFIKLAGAQRGKALTPAEAESLIGEARQIIAAL